MFRFVGIELISDRIPDEMTIMSFHNLMEIHDLEELIFDSAKAYLSPRGITIGQGIIFAATLVIDSSPTFTRPKPKRAGGSAAKREAVSRDFPSGTKR